MKVAVIGTGAMGSLVAALLAPWVQVFMVGSWSEQLETVRREGLVLVHSDGSESRHVLSTAFSGADAAGASLAIVVVKGWQTERAAQHARSCLAADGLAITLQNGLGNLETIAAAVGQDRTVQGVTSEGATMLRAGVVRHAGHGQTYFAAEDSTRLQLESAARLFSDAGMPTAIVDDAQALIWGKLAVNAGINPLTALLQVSNGYLLENASAYEIMARAAQETADVALALGITLPFDDAVTRAAEVAQATAANRSSMAQDIARGKPTEIEQITGAILQRGRTQGVRTPVNAALYQLVRVAIAGGDWTEMIGEISLDLQPIFVELSAIKKS